MPAISILLVCDGTSDFCIQDIIQWIVDEHFSGITFRIQVAREVVPAHIPLTARIKRACEIYEPNVIVCHRDAENQALAQRLREIEEAHAATETLVPIVPAVPIKMLESWLLFDSVAIRSAANNKNGAQAINLPPANRVENLPDPKVTLFSALQIASGLSPQRLKRFDVHKARARITGYIDTFAPLRVQVGFFNFEKKLIEKIKEQIQ